MALPRRTRPGRERITKARHDDVGIHPVDARARRNKAVRRVKPSRFGCAFYPSDPLAVGARLLARFAEHRRGGIDGVDPVGESREADRERSGPGSRVEDGTRLEKKAF